MSGSLSFCLRDSVIRPCTFGTHLCEVLQSPLPCRSPPWDSSSFIGKFNCELIVTPGRVFIKDFTLVAFPDICPYTLAITVQSHKNFSLKAARFYFSWEKQPRLCIYCIC